MTTTRNLISFLLLASSMALVGCGSGGDSGNSGELTLAFTDAASDDLAQFEVDVTNVMLTRLDGSTASVLTRRMRVDFAQLEELSDLVAGVSVPAGVYNGLTMTLDFATAAILLKGSATPATVVDASGNPITGTQLVRVTFSSNTRPSIAVRRNRLFVLDLDLDQSVTTDIGANRVTFTPAMTATVDPTNPKPVAINGILTSVGAIPNSFMLDKRDANGNTVASIRVTVDNQTIWQLNGVAMIGSVGLATLASMPIGTRVFAQGTVNRNTLALAAVAVEGGTGTFGNGQDWVEGHIVARNNSAGQDATLTVRGRSHLSSTGTQTYNGTFTVNVFHGTTKVLKRGFNAASSTDVLDVGQRVLCFGALSGTTLDCTTSTSVVRALKTSVFGVATGAASGNVLTLNVSRYDLRPVGDFNFTVGGIPEADPANYTIDVTGLGTAGITAGSRIRALGWVNPVGVVGDANFAALAIVNRQTSARLMLVAWPSSAASTITSATSNGLTLDVSGASLKQVEDGFSSITLTAIPEPSVVPPANNGFFRIVRNGTIEVHLFFNTFLSSLNTQRSAGAKTLAVFALGAFNETSQAIIATTATVFLQ